MKTKSIRKIQLIVGIMLTVIILFQESQSFTPLSFENFLTSVTKYYGCDISQINSGLQMATQYSRLN